MNESLSTGTGYTEAEMLRMQRDAIRRVREMQSRARDFEQARRSAAADGIIPRPTLTGNPIGSGTARPQPAEPPPPPQPLPPPQPPPADTPQGLMLPGPYPRPGEGGQSPRGSPAYRGPRQQSGDTPGQSDRPGGLLGSLGLGGLGGLGSLFSGQGIAGIGQNLGSYINGLSDPVKAALSSLGLDNDRLLIILIMLLVFTQDEYDNILLLALGYMLF